MTRVWVRITLGLGRSLRAAAVWGDDKRVNFIEGFRFGGYRSFPSADPAELYPLTKINLIAGQNNAGKSNILRVISATFARKYEASSDWLNAPHGETHRTYSRSIFYSEEEVLEWIPDHSSINAEEIRSFIQQLPESEGAPSGIYLPIANARQDDMGGLLALSKNFDGSSISTGIAAKIGRSFSGDPEDDALGVLSWLSELRPEIPVAVDISGNRLISAGNEVTPDLNGTSIKRRLQRLKSPTTLDLADRQLFEQFEEFVRTVLDDPALTVDVAHDLSTIHITQNGRTLPIENVGTGLHEVIIIAAAATVTRDSIVCMEEPELHLHPVLQRKLLRYLEKTSNQYFIATHSAHMLDSQLGSIFHVSHDGAHSAVRYAGKASDRAAICADLGYRPSDLVQSNAVIWVEGPSDRTYVRMWIDALAPDTYIEGTHYSIMFYGGSLLKELSPLDADDVEEFVSLCALNRNMVVIIDSDKKNRNDPLNQSKQRVIKGVANYPGLGITWVTAGYTIENYIPEAALTTAIKAAHKSLASSSFAKQTQYENPLNKDRLGIQKPSKVAIAKAVGKVPISAWPFDLQLRMQEVIELIRRANQNM